MVADPQVVSDNQWPYTVELLRVAKEAHWQTALATISHRREALHVLRSLDLECSLEVVLTREDVKQGSPTLRYSSLRPAGCGWRRGIA